MRGRLGAPSAQVVDGYDKADRGPAHSDMPVTVVVPAYNEVDNIEPLVGEIQAALAGRDHYAMIFIDDGSTDGTSDRLIALRSRKALPLKVIRHKRNFGQSAALWTGIKAAATDWVVTLDGDGQNDPADIPLLLARLDQIDGRNKPLLVCGHRCKRQDSLTKRLSSIIANGVRSWLLGDNTPDTGCGLKLIHRQTFLDLPFFDHMHRFLPALIQRGGGRTVSIEVNHRPRRKGRSKYGVHDRLWVGIIDLMGVMWLKKRSKTPAFEEI